MEWTQLITWALAGALILIILLIVYKKFFRGF